MRNVPIKSRVNDDVISMLPFRFQFTLRHDYAPYLAVELNISADMFSVTSSEILINRVMFNPFQDMISSCLFYRIYVSECSQWVRRYSTIQFRPPRFVTGNQTRCGILGLYASSIRIKPFAFTVIIRTLCRVLYINNANWIQLCFILYDAHRICIKATIWGYTSIEWIGFL